MSEPRIVTRRTAIGLGVGVAAAAVMAGLVSLKRPTLSPVSTFEDFIANSVRGRVESVSDIRGYLAANADGVGLSPVTGVAGIGVSSGVVDMHSPVLMRYTFMDNTMVSSDDTFDSVWNVRRDLAIDALLFQYEGLSTVYDVGNPDYFVVMADASVFNNADLEIVDALIGECNNQAHLVDGAWYDKDTHIAYIPREWFRFSDLDFMPHAVIVQLMIRASARDRIEADVPYRIVSEVDGVPSRDDVVHVSGHDLGFAVPVTADGSPLPDDCDVSVWISDCEIPLGTDGFSACVNAEHGLVHVYVCQVCVSGVEIRVSQSKAVDPLAVVMSRVARATTYAEQRTEDSGALREWSHGYLRYRPDLDGLVGAVWQYTGTAFSPDDITRVPDVISSYTIAFYDDMVWNTYEVVSDGRNNEYYDIMNNVSPTQHGHPTTMQFWIEHCGEYWRFFPGQASDAGYGNTWAYMLYLKNADHNLYDTYAHFLFLPGCDMCSGYSIFGENDGAYWKTIKNAHFKNGTGNSQFSGDTMIGTDAENNAGYNSCTLTCANCAILDDPLLSGDPNLYANRRIRGRILEINKGIEDARYPNPYIVIAFATDAHGNIPNNSDGGTHQQESQCLIRFKLMFSGLLRVKKVVIGSDTTTKFGFHVIVKDKWGNLLTEQDISLAHNETWECKNLPPDAQYSVTEHADPSGFKFKSITSNGNNAVVNGRTTSGVVGQDATVDCVCENQQLSYVRLEKGVSA